MACRLLNCFRFSKNYYKQVFVANKQGLGMVNALAKEIENLKN